MEKNTTAVPKEFIERIESLERQLAALKEELAVFQASPAVETPAEAPSEAVDIDIDIIDMPDMPAVPDISPAEIPAADVEIPLPEIDDLPAEGMTVVPDEGPGAGPGPVEEPAAGPAVEPEAVAGPAEEPVAEPVPEAVAESEAESVAEPAPEPAPAPEEEDMPLFAEEVPAPAPVKAKRPAAADGNFAWKSARPGMPVRNIRSAISLFDRALFINTLFKEDYALYDKTIGELNELSTLDEAVDYVAARFPDWNFGSDVVYSFMMAIRKKLG